MLDAALRTLAVISPHMAFIHNVAGPMTLDKEDASMPAPPPPLHLSSQFGPYGVFVAPAGEAVPSLHAGERVGGPPPRRRRRLLRRLLLLGLAGAGGAVLIAERRDDVSALLSLATAAWHDPQPRRQVAAAPEDAKLSEPLPVLDREVASAPVVHGDPAPQVSAPDETAPVSRPSAAAPETGAAPERLPAVVADPKDPLQQKALAAGLHPDLSRALLTRLTAEDFRNAAHAVQAVLATQAPATPVVWPRQRTPQRPQFKARLVAGAPSECRRYVVQIAIDGWETTARPMERCNARQAFKPS